MSKRKGFTLIELLVVISIIALLVSILMPALNRARQQATAAVCQGNQKALITAWIMYAGDNGGRIVGGVSKHPNYSGLPCYDAAWIWGPTVTETGVICAFSGNDTNLISARGQEYRKEGIRRGKLWKYSKTAEIYHCPGDKSFKQGAPKDQYVSYAITGAMNGEDHGNENPTAYTTESQIKGPQERMVFVEEINDDQNFLAGSFQFHATVGQMWDYMAIWHNKRGTLSFVDGHAETKEWSDKRTVEVSELEREPEDAGYADMNNAQYNEDVFFLARAYTTRKK